MALVARLLPLVPLVLLSAPAGAATFVVDRFDDVSAADGCLLLVAGDCSLRGATLRANAVAGSDTIWLAKGIYRLTIEGSVEDQSETGDLDLREDVVIEGAGAGVTIIEADIEDRVVDVRAGVIAFLRRLTVRGGNEPGAGGGGIRNYGLVTILQQSQVEDNVSWGPGGGILSSLGGALWLQQTLVWLNTSHQGGGGIRVEGAGSALTLEDSSLLADTALAGASELETSETLGVLRNTTVSDPFGGEDLISATGSTLTLDACTLFVPGPAPAVVLTGSTVTLRNSLIAGGCAADAGSTLGSDGGNLESPGATCDLGASDLENVSDPALSPIDRFGGPTPTHRPLSTSPAVDFAPADAHCQTRDQRGIARPQEAGPPGLPHCDVGAVERVAGELFLDGFEGGSWWGWSTSVP